MNKGFAAIIISLTIFFGACACEKNQASAPIDKELLDQCLADTAGSDYQRLVATMSPTADFNKTDVNGNGVMDAYDLLRIAQGGISRPEIVEAKSGDPAPSVTLLLARLCAQPDPAVVDGCYFTRAMLAAALSAQPLANLIDVASGFGGSDACATGMAGMDKIINVLPTLLDPEMTCHEGGLAQCGKEVSRSLAQIEDLTRGYDLADTRLTVRTAQGDRDLIFTGRYNEAGLRLLAAVGEVLAGALYFASAHIDTGALMSEVAPLLSGGLNFQFTTAGAAMTTIQKLSPLLVKILQGAVSQSSGPDKLRASQESVSAAIAWLNGEPDGKAAIIKAIETGGEEGSVVRFIDTNGNGEMDACDYVEVNQEFINASLTEIFSSSGAQGCTGGPMPHAFQLPKESQGQLIDYTTLFSSSGQSLTTFGTALNDRNASVTAQSVNAVIQAVGSAPLQDVFEFRPAVLFESGLSGLAPKTGGPGAAAKIALEMEINADVPEDAGAGIPFCGGKLPIYKSPDGKIDWSGVIKTGDRDHFGGAVGKDDLWVDEALLDSAQAPADSFFRVSQGGGFLLYLQFKDPAWKGMVRVRKSLVEELTDSSVPVCSRKIGQRASGDFVSLDDRTTSALLSYFMIQSQACGNTGL